MRIPKKTMETVMEQILLQHRAEAENAALPPASSPSPAWTGCTATA